MSTKYIYECVNSTDYERYLSLGVFDDFEKALAYLTANPEEPPCDDAEDYVECEIRKRPLNIYSDVGYQVHAVEWSEEYDEATDEYKWHMESLPCWLVKYKMASGTEGRYIVAAETAEEARAKAQRSYTNILSVEEVRP